jgi:hypothetical protein
MRLQLSDPLLTYELYDCFIAVNKFPSQVARIEAIRRVISLLPPGNRAILKRLIAFLRSVHTNSKANKMHAANLAIVFAPTILRPANEDPATFLTEGKAANELINDMVRRLSLYSHTYFIVH